MSELVVDIEKWASVEEKLNQRFGKTPDLQTIIFLVGHRELGQNRTTFTKEEKQDLIHVGVCKLLSQVGYYNFVSNDKDGWPHYEPVRGKEKLTGEQQELLLKQQIITYFEHL